jgi:hypothetical protein
MSPRIYDWQWDEYNLSELADHGITAEVVIQVSQEAPRFRPNKKNRAASHLMIGPDRGGSMWTICILRVPLQLDTWRAITGWEAENEDRKWYRRNK